MIAIAVSDFVIEPQWKIVCESTTTFAVRSACPVSYRPMTRPCFIRTTLAPTTRSLSTYAWKVRVNAGHPAGAWAYASAGRTSNDVTVTAKRQLHHGDSYGYRLERGGQAMVYSTDSEHKLDDAAGRAAFVEFFRDADLVIFDAMYSLADAISVKADWGHSSNIAGVELCHAAGVKHLCMFHHEPAFDDASIARVLADTRRYEEICRTGAPMTVTAAYDGMEIGL